MSNYYTAVSFKRNPMVFWVFFVFGLVDGLIT